MNHKEHVDMLLEKKRLRHEKKKIQSKSCQIGTNNIKKMSFSYFDYKRYILDDGIKSLVHEHEDIN